MSIEVKRSPARVCWWVVVNGVLLNTHETKWLAEQEASNIKKKYL